MSGKHLSGPATGAQQGDGGRKIISQEPKHEIDRIEKKKNYRATNVDVIIMRATHSRTYIEMEKKKKKNTIKRNRRRSSAPSPSYHRTRIETPVVRVLCARSVLFFFPVPTPRARYLRRRSHAAAAAAAAVHTTTSYPSSPPIARATVSPVTFSYAHTVATRVCACA